MVIRQRYQNLQQVQNLQYHIYACYFVHVLYRKLRHTLRQGNIIDFANDIMKNNKRNKGEVRVHYKLIKYNKKGKYKIL